MEGRTVAPGRIQVETTGLLTRRHRLVQGEKRLGEFHLGRSTTYTDADGRRMRIERPSLWRGEIRLWVDDQVRATAQLRPLEPRIEVRFGATRLWLQRVDRVAQTWALVDGEPLLTIRRTGWRRAEITVHTPIDGDLVAFSYYLVVIRWRARYRHRST